MCTRGGELVGQEPAGGGGSCRGRGRSLSVTLQSPVWISVGGASTQLRMRWSSVNAFLTQHRVGLDPNPLPALPSPMNSYHVALIKTVGRSDSKNFP